MELTTSQMKAFSDKHGLDAKGNKEAMAKTIAAEAKKAKAKVTNELNKLISGTKEEPKGKKRSLKDKKNAEDSYYQKAKNKVSDAYDSTKKTVVDGYETTKAHMNKATVVAHVDGVRDYAGFVVKMGLGLGVAYVGATYLGIGIMAGFAILIGAYFVANIISSLLSRKKIGKKYEVGFFRTIWNSIKEVFNNAFQTVNCFRTVEVAVK